jgi:SAM-dependent methyltransferase
MKRVARSIRRQNYELRTDLGPLHLWEVKEWVKNLLTRSPWVFNWYLRRTFPVSLGVPAGLGRSAVMERQRDWELAYSEVERLGLPHAGGCKDWDSLIALQCILKHTTPESRILDAGAEYYSKLLVWLHLYGYRQLYGLNLSFSRSRKVGAIRYQKGDITDTHFGDACFDAATCLSVVEHGVDASAFFAEMHRIIRPGGLLVVSTDYADPKIDTAAIREEYRRPTSEDENRVERSTWKIFSRREIEDLVSLAAASGFTIDELPESKSAERFVRYLGQEYSFITLCFARDAWPKRS